MFGRLPVPLPRGSPATVTCNGVPLAYVSSGLICHPPSSLPAGLCVFRNGRPGPIGSSYVPAMVSICGWSLLSLDHSAAWLFFSVAREAHDVNPEFVFDIIREYV